MTNFTDSSGTVTFNNDYEEKARYVLKLEILLMKSNKLKEFIELYKKVYGKYLLSEKEYRN
jgi:hypothetical protein